MACIANKNIPYIEDIEQTSSRICVVCLKTTKSWKLALMSAYAPQSGRPKQEKEAFYGKLKETIQHIDTT